jgi:hypothetical protein
MEMMGTRHFPMNSLRRKVERGQAQNSRGDRHEENAVGCWLPPCFRLNPRAAISLNEDKATAAELIPADGVTALKHHRYALAFHILQPFAERGYAVAQVNLGTLFLHGLGGPIGCGRRDTGSRPPPRKDSVLPMAGWARAVMTGDFAMNPPTAAEIARRERMNREG